MLLSTLGLILIGSLVALRFADFFLELFPGKGKKKILKIFNITILGLVGLFTISSLFFTLFKIGKAYYNNPDYWNEYIFYRNDQVTKICDPTSGAILVFYDEWKEMQEVSFDIKDTLNGFELIDTLDLTKYSNDSIITEVMNFKMEGLEYVFTTNHTFAQRGYLSQMISTYLDEEPAYRKEFAYRYDNEKFIERTVPENQDFGTRLSVTYFDKFNYLISEFNSYQQLISEEIWEHNSKGLPISCLTKEWFTLSATNKRAYGETEETTFEYTGQGFTKNVKNLQNDTEDKYLYGKGFELLSVERDANKSSSRNSQTYKYIYDKYGNWIVQISSRSNITYAVTLRRFKYKNGVVTGSIDQNKIKSL